MATIIDAGVAALLFIDDPRSEAADHVVRTSPEDLIAPDLLPVQVTNALLKAHQTSKHAIHIEPVLERLSALIAYEPSSTLLIAATTIARDLDHPIYDSLYLALLERGDHTLITADRQLVDKIAQTRYAKHTRLLSAAGHG